jgi:hypothetical protein
MHRSSLLAAAFGLLATAAQAETPVTASEFDALVTGKTMDYYEFGDAFGREEYLPGRRVRWAFTADVCKFGTWYEDDSRICFLYDGDPDPKCWTYWLRGGQLIASHVDDTADMPPRDVVETDEPLLCAGPDVGV